MRQRYTLLLLFIFQVFTLTAQIEEVPLTSNPVLRQHQAQEVQATQQRIRQLTDRLPNTNSATTRSFFNCDNIMIEDLYADDATLYIQSEETVEICIDTLQLQTNGGFASITCTNCDATTSGMASHAGNCVTYAANVISESEVEILTIELCALDGTCENINFDIILRRANQSFDEPTTLVEPEAVTQLCVSTGNYLLPGAINTTDLLSNDEVLGTAYNGNSKDSCFVYEANRFAELDIVSFEICDDNCICDNFNFPIRVVGDTLDIPFLDDFSYAGPYPSQTNWLDRNVFINNTMAFQPPSVGVATFDGVDETGTPYYGGYGQSDFLTSNYFDLSAVSDDVYLSFYYQAKGLMRWAPSLGDSLVVEFKNDQGEWVAVAAFDGPGGAPSNTSSPFAFAAFPIDEPEYLFNGFQFRFLNFGDRKGIRGNWHLDYVRLSTNEIPDSTGTFDDIAFTQVPNSLLDRYTSMPWWQFEGFEDAELGSDITLEVYNHFSGTKPVLDSKATTIELNTNTSFPIYVPFDGSQFNIPSQVHQMFNNDLVEYDAYLNQMQNSFTGATALRFETTYAYENTEQNAAYEATATNDTVRYTTVFDNYFSYDDGTAESAIFFNIVSYQVAVEFKANHPDTLRAIEIHFPHMWGNTVESQLFNIRVWVGELDDTPEYKQDFVKPFYADNVVDTLQGFTTYRLVGEDGLTPEGLALPAGDFYIGFQQVSVPLGEVSIPIGWDKNTSEAGQYVFVNDLGGWTPGGLDGAPMMRAVVGGVAPWNTPVEELKPAFEVVGIYPNPTTDYLSISLETYNYVDFEYFIINAEGKILKWGELEQTIDVTDLPGGIYYLNLYNQKTQVKSNHEFIIIK